MHSGWRRRRASTGTRPPRRRFFSTEKRPPLRVVRRRASERLLERGRPSRCRPVTATGWRSSMNSPLTRTTHKITYKEFAGPRRVSGRCAEGERRGKGRSRHHLHADGARGAGGDALPARVWVRSIRRGGGGGGVVFGGFAANELAVRIDDCTPKCIIAASCGIRAGARGCITKPPSGRGACACRPRTRVLRDLPARTGGRASGGGGAMSTWHAFQYGVAPAALRPGWRATTRPISSTPPARPASPRGVVRHTAGHLVALKLVDVPKPLRHEPRRGLLGRLGRGLGRGPFLHLLRAVDPSAAPLSCSRANPWARRMPAPSGA